MCARCVPTIGVICVSGMQVTHKVLLIQFKFFLFQKSILSNSMVGNKGL